MKKKIGVLYICTGKYDRFFKEFYETSEKFFLTDCEKTYFVFTDSKDEVFEKENVMKIEQSRLGWPYDTLMRFKMFSRIEKEISQQDFVFFFNANMAFNQEIKPEEFLPLEEESGLASVLHSTFYKTGVRGTFEHREESAAYIPFHLNPAYFQGCLYGGKSDKFLEMNKVCLENVQKDLDKGLIAMWHDESHMNKYFSQIKIKELHPGFAYPEMLSLPYEKKIIQLEKANVPGGHKYLRS